MPEIKMTKVQLLNISQQLDKSSPDDLGRVISLLTIAFHHVEASDHPGRASTLYVLALTRKVMEKYNEMIHLRPDLGSTRMDGNFRKHMLRVMAQLNQFSSEI